MKLINYLLGVYLVTLSVTVRAQDDQNYEKATAEQLASLKKTCPELNLLFGSYKTSVKKDYDPTKPIDDLWNEEEMYCPENQIVTLNSTMVPGLNWKGAPRCNRPLQKEVGDLVCLLAKDYNPTTKSLADKYDAMSNKIDGLAKRIDSLTKELESIKKGK